MKTTDKIERDIENYLGAKAEEHGVLYLKFISPGNAGVPDRVLINKTSGIVGFVELKRPHELPRPLQVSWIIELKKRGCPVFVVSDNESAKQAISDFTKLKRGPVLSPDECLRVREYLRRKPEPGKSTS